MGKRIFFMIASIVLSALFIRPVLATDIDHNVELDKICKASHCIIPVPTLVDPNEKIIKIDQDFYLTGLTWNNTKIGIYVDNEYQGLATVINDDDSDTANFYYLIENDSLLEGIHEWGVIAWAETLRKRSYVSTKNSFTIENYFLAPILDKITNDIDNNYWIVGSAENNSLVNIYVDNVYQGQVRADGNFNYNLGRLLPGLHTFYVTAQEATTGQTSKRSNMLSKRVLEISAPEEVIESEISIETVDTKAELEIDELEPIIETETEINKIELEETDESEVPLENGDIQEEISSISEEKGEDGDIIIQDEKSQDNVRVNEVEDHDIEVGVISHEKSQDQIVVDSQKSELSEINEEDKEKEDTITEELQTATPSNEITEMIMEELNIVEKQEKNRKVGLWFLIILIVIVVVFTFLSGQNTKLELSKEKEKKDDDPDSHQGDLFNRE